MKRTILAALTVAAIGASAVAIQPRTANAACKPTELTCRRTPLRIEPSVTFRDTVKLRDLSIFSIKPDFMTHVMGPNSIALGESDEFLAMARNDGPGPIAAAHVTLTIEFPSFVAATTITSADHGFSCAITTPQLITCTGATLKPDGDTALVRFRARGVAEGWDTMKATVNPGGTIAESAYENNIEHRPLRVVKLR